MAAKKNSTELALMDSFKIANRYEGIDPELMAELQDELGDLDPESGITCRQIKVPSGGGLAFEVQGEDEGDAEPMKEIDGVILFTHRLSAYWPGSFGSASNPEDKIPTCSSMDGKTGIVQAGDRSGEIITCETCPYNQYGTGVDEKGNPSRGKACKNMRRIYLMMDGDPNFYLLSVPPTSIKDVNKQLAKILASGVPYTGMIVTLSLEKTKNNNGVAYSKVIIKKKGVLPSATAAQVQALRGQIKAQYQSMAITMDDYAAAPVQQGKGVDVTPDDAEMAAMNGAAFEEAPPHTDDDLPFA